MIDRYYHDWRPFLLAAIAYAVASAAFMLHWRTGRPAARGAASVALVLAVLLHGAGFAARWSLAGRIPIQNLYESMIGASLAAAVLALALMAFRRAALFGFAGAVSGLATVTAAVGLPIPGRTIEAEAAILSTAPLLKYHVGAVLLAYASISLGAVASLMVLLARFRARSDERLAELDRAQTLFAQLAAWLLAVGILLGAWWAHAAWGRWWAFDPKETWALLTWCVFLASIHLRNALPERFRPTATASLNLLGFLVMLWSWFGVNLLLTGLHSYA